MILLWLLLPRICSDRRRLIIQLCDSLIISLCLWLACRDFAEGWCSFRLLVSHVIASIRFLLPFSVSDWWVMFFLQELVKSDTITYCFQKLLHRFWIKKKKELLLFWSSLSYWNFYDDQISKTNNIFKTHGKLTIFA